MNDIDSTHSELAEETSKTIANPPAIEDKTLLYQAPAYLLRLTHQTEHLEAQISTLLGEVQQNNRQLQVLTRHATEASATRLIEQRLADLVSQLEEHQEQLETLSNTVKSFSQLDGHQTELKNLGKTLKKLTRTHFKANTLNESQQGQIQNALGTLRELVTQRDDVQPVSDDVNNQQQRLKATRKEARHEMAAELLPALDGVENAIESGRALLKRRQIKLQEVDAEIEAEIEKHNKEQVPSPPPAPSYRTGNEGNSSFWSRLDYAFGGELPDKPAAKVLYQTVKVKVPAPSDEPFFAWLDGLELVRERFLSILRHEEITPILALDQLFDPRLHVAIEAVERDDVPPGTVVDVIRKGYRQSGRVLRYAEVVVSKSTSD